MVEIRKISYCKCCSPTRMTEDSHREMIVWNTWTENIEMKLASSDRKKWAIWWEGTQQRKIHRGNPVLTRAGVCKEHQNGRVGQGRLLARLSLRPAGAGASDWSSSWLRIPGDAWVKTWSRQNTADHEAGVCGQVKL